MRNAWISMAMAVILVVASGSAAAAGEPAEDATQQAEAAPPAFTQPFDITPAMTWMLSQPVPPPEMKLFAAPRADYLAQRSRTSGGSSGRVVAAVAFGFAGMLPGIAVGQKLGSTCHCGDGAMAGASTECSSARLSAPGSASGSAADRPNGIYNGG
jgi:hypothetical protein